MRILIVVCLFLAAPAGAIVNIGPAEVGDAPGISGNVAGSYVTKSGNTDKDEYDVSARLQYDNNDRNLYYVQGSFEQTEVSDTKTEDETFLHARYLRLIHAEVLYGELFTQYWEDEFKSIKDRWLAGGNLRWRFMNHDTWGQLYLGLGLFHEEVHYTPDAVDADESKTRFNSYMAYTHELTTKSTFNAIAYFQPAVDDTSDYYTAFVAELDVHIVSDLHLSLLYEIEYDSAPPLDVEKEDRKFSTSLVWKF